MLLLLSVLIVCQGQNPPLQENMIRKDTSRTSGTLGPDVLGCSMMDKKGNLWFGCSESGLYYYNGSSFTHFSAKDGLADPHIFSLLEDKTGTVWVGTFGGLFQYNGTQFKQVVIPHSRKMSEPDAMGNIIANPDCIMSILEDRNGNLWFGSMGFGVYRYDGKSFTFFPNSLGLDDQQIQCIIETRKGELWMGTRGGGLWLYNGTDFTHHTFKAVNDNHILDILEDRNGGFWLSAVGTGVRYYANDSFVTFTSSNSSHAFSTTQDACFRNVFNMLQDNTGNIWFCGDGGGLCCLNGKSVKSYTTQNGLGSNRVTSAVEDKQGNIWLGTRGKGLYRFDGKVFIDLTSQLESH